MLRSTCAERLPSALLAQSASYFCLHGVCDREVGQFPCSCFVGYVGPQGRPWPSQAEFEDWHTGTELSLWKIKSRTKFARVVDRAVNMTSYQNQPFVIPLFCCNNVSESEAVIKA